MLAGRYAVERELGSGGMGAVYQVLDLARGERVALKTLQWSDAAAIYRFKQEFRVLADVAHPNLVQLHELVAQDEIWFITMELVRGTSFVRHVRPGYGPGPATPRTDKHLLVREEVASYDAGSPVAPDLGDLDERRLRAALRQLVQGVAALHAAGIVHRDLKPSNVLVTDEGRVVILDFGIATAAGRSDTLQTAEHGFPGTIEYMSPEQCSGAASVPASDWYAVGVLLYESLTGRLPFPGTGFASLIERMAADPPRADAVAPGAPSDLAELCAALLARAPEARPTDEQLLDRMGLSLSDGVLDAHGRPAEGVRLVGRAPHLAALGAAFAEAAGGHTVSVCVHGPSGIGKTAVVREFTDDLEHRRRALVLAGRCFVRESVPYKALDGVIDMLSRVLRSAPPESVADALPADTAALVRVFPVLRRVEAVERFAADELQISDHRELRRRAFAAFRDLLGALARRRPVVIHIDDLQWADRDSADVLDDLLRASGVPLLIVLSFRSEDVEAVPLLGRLLARTSNGDRRALAIGPLAPREAERYARRMLEPRHDASSQARILAMESAGNPFLLEMMVRAAMQSAAGDSTPQDLEAMLAVRLAQMPAGARQLVEVLAVAGQPTVAGVAYRAADLAGDERQLVTSLSLAHLLRASATSGRIDLYHDRIREIVLRELPDHRVAAIHRRLVEELEATGVESPETMYEHCLGAGERNRAAGFAAVAAAEAQAALAFERAALFYQRALDLRSEPGAETAAWLVGLGDALASAGRAGEAARAYLAAKPMLDEATAIEVERRAGQQFLISGRLQEGLAVVGRVLARVGLPPLATSPRRALMMLVLRRLRLVIRGLGYRERGERAIPADVLTRIDTCWTVAEGMALADNIQGTAYQAIHLKMALDAGEPLRIARALAMEAGFAATTGAPQKGERLLRQAEAMAQRLGSRPTLGLCRMIGASAAVHGGRFEEGERLSIEAESILTEQQGLSAWPLSIARVYHISALIHEGKIVELCRVSRQCLDDATARGNIFAATMYRTGWSALMWLGCDDLAGARASLAEALTQTPRGVFFIPHYHCLLAQGLIDLYAGSGAEAYEHIAALWPLLEESLVMRIRSIQVLCRRMRASCAVAAAREASDPAPLLAIAEREARRMERETQYSPALIRAWAKVIRGGVACVRGDRAAALACLEAAVAAFTTCRTALYLNVARRLKGELIGGDAGRALVAEADAWMAGEEIANPARLAFAFAPGFTTVDRR